MSYRVTLTNAPGRYRRKVEELPVRVAFKYESLGPDVVVEVDLLVSVLGAGA